MEFVVFHNALVSVSDKTGLVDFLKPYVAQGLRVVSTGGTLKHLRENGIAAVDISEQTGFPEVMDGRVKTLHPRVHMAILSRAGNHQDDLLMKKEGLDPFDLIIVNLYPFADALKKGVKGSELIEFIDIGGPSLLRGAAKNHDRLAVVCDPKDYVWLADRKDLAPFERRRLAAKVFAHTSQYDALIASALSEEDARPAVLMGSSVVELRYGENPHQKAKWFKRADSVTGLQDAKILHGKPLSFNNLLDLDAAVATVREFAEPCAVGVKHNNPCGVGTAETITEALSRAIASDPVSIFGGIIACNREIDVADAEVMAKIFLECIIAPSFTSAALEKLSRKKDLRLLAWPEMLRREDAPEFRTISGGFLVQAPDIVSAWSSEWKILSQSPGQSLSDEIKTDLVLAWRVCAKLKSNAIAIVAGGQTLGLGMGQVNRVDAVEQAVERMRKHHPNLQSDSLAQNGLEPVLASDAFFPFADSIEVAAKNGIKWIIQPGGSIRDQEVIAKAEELGLNMVLTGVRHFRH
jgi:phosphoribosylaminoimidazolecarboxamide formyltransferase/IMP cyclohydrolase